MKSSFLKKSGLLGLALIYLVGFVYLTLQLIQIQLLTSKAYDLMHDPASSSLPSWKQWCLIGVYALLVPSPLLITMGLSSMGHTFQSYFRKHCGTERAVIDRAADNNGRKPRECRAKSCNHGKVLFRVRIGKDEYYLCKVHLLEKIESDSRIMTATMAFLLKKKSHLEGFWDDETAA